MPRNRDDADDLYRRRRMNAMASYPTIGDRLVEGDPPSSEK